MPKYRTLDKDFFKSWSSEMAYVLGYIAADGNISIGKRGNCYLALEGIDKGLIVDMRKALGSNHRIAVRERGNTVSYRLQIGSKGMVNDFAGLGMKPKKTDRLNLPDIPKSYFGDFIRGYFDGDGNAYLVDFSRTDRDCGRCRYIRIMFVSSSADFLGGVKNRLEKEFGISGGLMKNYGSYRRLYFRRRDSVERLFALFYGCRPGLYLKRKLVYFKGAFRKINEGA